MKLFRMELNYVYDCKNDIKCENAHSSWNSRKKVYLLPAWIVDHFVRQVNWSFFLSHSQSILHWYIFIKGILSDAYGTCSKMVSKLLEVWQ